MKTVWLTSLISSEDRVKHLLSQLKTYGLDVTGHFWEDNLEKMSWVQARDALLKPETAAWLVLASKEKMQTASIRYGLSLLAITVNAQRGLAFPSLMLVEDSQAISPEELPTPLKGIEAIPLNDASLGARIVARVHTPAKEMRAEYRLDVYGNPHIGQWFEVGPENASWSGAMFGVCGGEITFHATGPKGSLPEKAVLEHPMKGLKVEIGGKEYTAWAVQNQIDRNQSYFIQVKGYPESIMFGPCATAETAEVYIMQLS
jgi:hypothetical protein